jgi:hypothetical protein
VFFPFKIAGVFGLLCFGRLSFRDLQSFRHSEALQRLRSYPVTGRFEKCAVDRESKIDRSSSQLDEICKSNAPAYSLGRIVADSVGH